MAKKLQELDLADDFLFAKCMSDEEICRQVLEKILHIDIRKVELLSSQKTIDLLLESKGVRLDVYVADDNNTVYNVEMQRTNKQIPKRSRYYQGTLDLDMIQKGSKYKDLRESYVIFICTFDMFTLGRHVYSFCNYCSEDKALELKDGTHKIFINTRGYKDDVDSEMEFFLRYIENSTESLVVESNSPLLRKVHQKVEIIRKSVEMEVEYMTLLSRYEEIAEEAAEEAAKKAAEEAAQKDKRIAINMLKDQVPISKISQYLNVPEEAIRKWKEEVPE